MTGQRFRCNVYMQAELCLHIDIASEPLSRHEFRSIRPAFSYPARPSAIPRAPVLKSFCLFAGACHSRLNEISVNPAIDGRRPCRQYGRNLLLRSPMPNRALTAPVSQKSNSGKKLILISEEEITDSISYTLKRGMVAAGA